MTGFRLEGQYLFSFGELKREPKLKRKQMQGSLYSLFGGKQSSDDKEVNTESETSALTKKSTRRHGSNYKWPMYDGKENKILCVFCRELPNRKNMQYSLRIGRNNFQTDNLKAHKTSEGHTVRQLFWQPCTGK